MTEAQRAVLNEVRSKLGAAGLYSLEVDQGEMPILQAHDPETEDGLGLAGYDEVMKFLSPPGLETAGRFEDAWHKMRGTSATIFRQQERWGSYVPLHQQEEAISLERNSQPVIFTKDQCRRDIELRQQHKRVVSQIRRLGPQGVRPHEEELRAFIYVQVDEDDPVPLSKEHNGSGDNIRQPDHLTMIQLDNLHYNFGKRPNAGLHVDQRAQRLLVHLLNGRIADLRIGGAPAN